MKHHDKEYSTRISSLRVLLRDSRPDISRIEQHIDAIITTKKAYTNDLRLESNREIRAQGESMLAQQDEEVRGILSSAPQVVQACPKVKVLRDLIDRSTMYINLEGKGNAQLLDGAKDLQQKTLDSIAQSKMMVYASTDVGEKTLVELQHQRIQVEKIQQNVNEIDSKLGRAAALVADYKERISRNTFCRMMTVINCLLILLVIAFFVLSK